MPKSVKGQEKTWEILELLGEGDAGQVARVSADSGQIHAVMKRPVLTASGGTILRQAAQIENEGKVLQALEGLNTSRAGMRVTTPLLLDRSPEGSSGTASLFIVSQEAPGTPIAKLLQSRVRGDNVISQVLVLKILAALLQMLRAVHARGVVWNDVKMDHVYWESNSNSFCFIDWGNSLKATGNAEEDAALFNTDYQQLFPEGVLLIRQTAPELIQEIGWPIDGKALSDDELMQLQFRVEYAAEYFAHRVIEYQLLFRTSLQDLADLPDLQELLSLRTALKRLGVEVEDQAVLQAAQSFAQEAIRKDDLLSVERAAELILQEIDPEKTGNWQSLVSIFKNASLKEKDSFKALVECALNADRESFLWQLSQLRSDLPPGLFAWHVVATRNNWSPEAKPGPVLKEELTSYADELHMMALRSQKQGSPEEVQDEIRRVSGLVDQILGEWAKLSPGQQFGWQALRLRETIQTTPIRPNPELNQVLTRLLSQIREVYKSWEAQDLEATRKRLQALLLLDPNQTYLHELDAEIEGLQTWLAALTEGPQGKRSINGFASDLIENFPKAHFALGLTDWLQGYWIQASTLAAAQDLLSLKSYTAELNWDLPWLQLSTAFVELPEDWLAQFRMNAAQSAAVSGFHKNLHLNFSRADFLSQIHQTMPAFHRGYAQLDELFGDIFNQSTTQDLILNLDAFPSEDRQAIQASLEALLEIEVWKQKCRQGRAWKLPAEKPSLQSFRIFNELQATQKAWLLQIQPVLALLKQKDWANLPGLDSAGEELDPLSRACRSLSLADQEWKKIAQQGLYAELIQEIQYQLETAQTAFHEFWQALRQAKEPSMRWLAEEHQSQLGGINRSLLQMIRQAKNLAMAYELVNRPEMARTRLAHNSAGDLIFSLIQLEGLFENPSRRPSVIRDWQRQYLDLQKSMDRRSIIEGIQAIESIHPLLPWFDELVRRDADYFNPPALEYEA